MMGPRRIYVDIDDVLCETIQRLVDLLEHLHDRRVDPRAVEHFDLARSFGLDRAEIEVFMDRAHDDEVIESIEPVAGAADVLSDWKASGDQITLVTGRPPKTNAASRRWLESHRLDHDALHHLDKWARPSWNPEGLPAIRFEELPDFGFDVAIEDSLDTAVRLVEELDIPVVLMDRPWNRSLGHLARRTRDALIRCTDWMQVARVVDSV
ncbi:MAG TPA: hypothetical protein ENI85_07620 [Deltaproteobacteria bacterium]|nr:hypothetical protein [Deltaproteobacteria bacterium]